MGGAGGAPELSPPPSPVKPGAIGSGAAPGAMLPPPVPVGSAGLGTPPGIGGAG